MDSPNTAGSSICLAKPGWKQWIGRRGVAQTLACALAFLVYVPTLGFQFVYDDKPQIIENPAIHSWRYLPNYFTSHAWAELYPHVSGNYYRPLFLLWFRLNHAMFGLDPKGWHLTTILCHVAATYLVFGLVRRLAASPWIAFSAATLFALHPVHIESVAWVSGVTDPLMAIFLIGSFLAYLRFREGRRWGWMAWALLLFALGLLEKETAVVLGPLVFVYAWLYAEQRAWLSRLVIALKHCVGFLGLTILYLPLRAHVLRGLSHSVTPLKWSTMALTEPSVLWLYVRHLLFPIGLSGLYGLPYVEASGIRGVPRSDGALAGHYPGWWRGASAGSKTPAWLCLLAVGLSCRSSPFFGCVLTPRAISLTTVTCISLPSVLYCWFRCS